MGRPPSIQWYYKQYLGDNKVLAMDWDARGMHMHLLMLSIQEEPPGTIPADDAAIRRWLSLPLGSVDSDQTWRRVKSQLLAAWQPEGDRLANSGMKAACQRQSNYRERYEIGTKIPPNLNADEDIRTVLEVDVGSKSLTKPQVVELLDVQQAATFVCLKLGLSGIQVRLKVLDSVASYMHIEKVDARTAAETLVSLWEIYSKVNMKFKKGVGKFFEEGEWRNPAKWKDDDGLSEKHNKAAATVASNREVLLADANRNRVDSTAGRNRNILAPADTSGGSEEVDGVTPRGIARNAAGGV